MSWAGVLAKHSGVSSRGFVSCETEPKPSLWQHSSSVIELHLRAPH